MVTQCIDTKQLNHIFVVSVCCRSHWHREVRRRRSATEWEVLRVEAPHLRFGRVLEICYR